MTQWGRCVDIYAPGSNILSASHAFLPGACGKACSQLKSGTSMATPAVAGAAAVLRGRFPELAPADIELALKSGADALPLVVALGTQADRKAPVLGLRMAEDVLPKGYSQAPPSSPNAPPKAKPLPPGAGSGKPPPAVWESELCGPGLTWFSPERADFVSVAYGPTGRLYVAYSDLAHSGRVSVVTATSDAGWVLLGQAGFSEGVASHVKLAVAPKSGAVFVAYSDSLHGGKLVVQALGDNGAWEPLGEGGGVVSKGATGYQSPATGAGGADSILPTQLAALAVYKAAAGKLSSPAASLSGDDGGGPASTAVAGAAAYAQAVLNASSGAIDAEVVPAGDSFGIALVIDPLSEQPVVAFRDAGAANGEHAGKPYRLAVKTYKPKKGSWGKLGEFLPTDATSLGSAGAYLPFNAAYTELAADSNTGDIFLAFTQASKDPAKLGRLHVMRCLKAGGKGVSEPRQWKFVGKGVSPRGAIRPSMAVSPGGRLYVAFQDTGSAGALAGASVLSWDAASGGVWHYVGVPQLTGGPAKNVLIRVRPADDMPHLFVRDPLAGWRGSVYKFPTLAGKQAAAALPQYLPLKDRPKAPLSPDVDKSALSVVGQLVGKWQRVGDRGAAFSSGFALSFDAAYSPVATKLGAGRSAVLVSDDASQGVGTVYCRAEPSPAGDGGSEKAGNNGGVLGGGSTALRAPAPAPAPDALPPCPVLRKLGDDGLPLTGESVCCSSAGSGDANGDGALSLEDVELLLARIMVVGAGARVDGGCLDVTLDVGGESGQPDGLLSMLDMIEMQARIAHSQSLAARANTVALQPSCVCGI